jgi:Zn-dependent protease
MAVSLVATYSFLHAGPPDIEDILAGAAYDSGYTYGQIAATIVIIILSLSIHECGHAIVAWWCGDDYAKSLGRVTLNPLAHIDLFGTLVLPVLLTLAKAPVFGYAKPVPVRLGNVRRYRRAHILISLAGPGANLMLAAVSLALLLALGCALALLAPDARISAFSSALGTNVRIEGIPAGRVLTGCAVVLNLGFTINTLLAFFNLIPVPPLDGSWVLEHLFPNTLGRLYGLVRPFGFVVFLVLMYTNAFNYLLIPAAVPIGLGHGLIRCCTGL